MMKRNYLLTVAAMLSLAAVYAFAAPEKFLPARVLTIFFPEEEVDGRGHRVEGEGSKAKDGESKTDHLSLLTSHFSPPDTTPPLRERYDDFMHSGSNPVDLHDPKAIEQQVEYDPATNMYIITERIGDEYYRAPTYMTFEEYLNWREEQQQREYFDRLQGTATAGDNKSSSGITDPIAKFDVKTSLIDRLFGGTNVDIRPQGNIGLTFGYNYQKIQNPILTLRQQTTGNFDFDMNINMSATGKIGEKLNLNFNYNTQATFDFDNQMKLHYDPKGFSEDEIIQNIEAGNVSFPLRSTLIKGVQNLFGFKLETKFGHLRLTTVASQQRSKQQSLSVQGGSQIQNFEVAADEYDENRHFFLSQYNRNEFEPNLRCLPVPLSLFNITRLEVWITNDKNETQNYRDIVAFMDLAEPKPYRTDLEGAFPGQVIPIDPKNQPLPTNQSNMLYPKILDHLQDDSTFRFTDKVVSNLTSAAGDFNMMQIQDFEKVRARLLSPSEYTYNEQLGFISINLNVQPDQVVGFAAEYTYNGVPYKIGEFSSDVPYTSDSTNYNTLFVKMLKSTTANVKFPIWDLMMKNVYPVGSANVDPQEFRFDVFYEDPGEGQKRFLDDPIIPAQLKSKPLLQIFRLDTLNLQNDPGPDGIFDFVPGLTINLRSGRVMFPVLEPFGSYLKNKLQAAGLTDSAQIRKYIYPELYDSTLFRAREFQQYNRFTLKGSYKSANSSEISLGTFNLPQGSVRVSAGGRQLIEGQDYIVDYNIGKVKIVNDAILQSGSAVNVSFEDNSLFGFQSRTMLGVRADYALNKDINLGATFLNLFERPLTQKVNIGDDPINNKVYGLDANISKDAPWLTKLVDKLPLIETKEPSSITAQVEVAALQPGHSRAINQGEKGGVVYLDDFEGSTSNLPLANPANAWVLASVPQGDSVLFPESKYFADSLLLGANRARLAWYIADPSARGTVDANNPYTRSIQFEEIFPNRQLTPLEQSALRPLDVTIYPRERGPYNFDLPDNGTAYSAGLASNGQLNLPETRWAGFMKGLNQTDFEAANIEFIEFWMLNPYMEKNDANGTPVSDAGTMYIDLGTVSEDLMRDSRQFFENALPTDPNSGATVNTAWGRIPVLQPVVNAFDNDPAKRVLQDVGFDGLNDDQENIFYKKWVDAINASSLGMAAKDSIKADPSNDNFVYFRDPIFDNANASLIDRYRKFNNPQGNSPVNDNNNGINGLNPSATNLPDREDLNLDNTLNENEAFFRYRIPLTKTTDFIDPNLQVIDQTDPKLASLITDTVRVHVANSPDQIWYRFKVPLDESDTLIGGIQDFRAMRFIRVFWKGFSEQTTFRFATFELGRNQWRRYTQNLSCDFDSPIAPKIPFDVNAVSIEENAARTPFNYTIPYGISREQSVGAFPDILQNEQALAMNICELPYCDSRGIFKSLNMDLRQFKNLKMFVHGEATDLADPIDSNDLAVFIRLGSDFSRNYYEYEVPLVPSDPANLNGNPDSRQYKEEVWKPQNEFDFPLELLTQVKKARNAANGRIDTAFIISDPDHPRNLVKVVGNPNLGYVKGAMIGVHNVDPAKEEHCVEVWVNELRLSGFNEKGGYAGLARVDMKLADLGNVSVAGNYTSIGWGSIEQKLVQRQREEVIQYDISTNLELSKLLPSGVGLRLPFYAQYSNVTRNPEYDPYDLDIKLKDKLRAEADAAKRDSIRTAAQDVTVVRGFNFTNVRKERKGGRKVPLPWNIENFSLTYAYNQQKKRNPFIISDEQNQYKGAIDYQYATGLKPIQPFKKAFKNDKYLKLITELNFNPIPNTYGFSTNLERFVGRTTYRFAGEDPKLNTYYNRRFTWDRNYDLGWDITKNLRFNFDATARSLIDEPQQYETINGEYREVTKAERRDSILRSIKHLGRPKNYTHTATMSYTLPFKQIPFMDWVTVKASYTGGYTWTAQSLKLQDLDAGPYAAYENSRDLGNVIQNNATRQINGDLNFEALYNKSKYLQKINKPGKAGKGGTTGGKTLPGARPGRNMPGEEEEGAPGGIPEGVPGGGGKNPPPGKGGGLKPGSGARDEKGGIIPNDRTTDPTATTPPPPGAPPAAPGGAPSGAPPSAPGGKNPTTAPGGGLKPGGVPGAAPGTEGVPGTDDKSAPADKSKGGKGGVKGGKEKERQPSLAERIALRPLMLIRKGRFNYTENFGTVVPGFTPETKLMGLSEGFLAPGWAFVAGVQPESSWLDKAARNGWITERPELNQQVNRTYTQNLDAGLTIEPFTDFRVELTANRQYTKNSTELFKDQDFNLDPAAVDFQHRAQRDLGSLTVSYFTLKTLYNHDINELFHRFENNRPVISSRLGVESGNIGPHDKDDGYSKGYGRIQQEVLLPAFLAAYTETDPNKVGLDVFKTRPAVNWKLNYNGLSKLGKLDKIFSSIQISHGYKSTLTVNSYNTDIFYNPAQPYTIDSLNFNYTARYEIPQVVINEQFQPLLGIDVKLKNDMTFKLDFKKSRGLAMSFIDYQLAERNETGYTFGFGYRLKNVVIPFLVSKKAKAAAKKKKNAKKPAPGTTPGAPPPPAGGKTQGNDMNFKFDFDYRDNITINHQLDLATDGRATRGERTISINPQVDYALNKRLKLIIFTNYRKTVPKTSQSFPITTIQSGVTVQFTLN